MQGRAEEEKQLTNTEASELEYQRETEQYVDMWKKAAAVIPDSTRRQIVTMKKSGKSVREICLDLELALPSVSIIVIEEFAKERGESPVYHV